MVGVTGNMIQTWFPGLVPMGEEEGGELWTCTFAICWAHLHVRGWTYCMKYSGSSGNRSDNLGRYFLPPALVISLRICLHWAARKCELLTLFGWSSVVSCSQANLSGWASEKGHIPQPGFITLFGKRNNMYCSVWLLLQLTVTTNTSKNNWPP